MPRLDDLPPDLRATLSLLVDRGKSYAQVAELLGISESAVRDRAHAALDALAGVSEASSPPSASPSDAAPAPPATRGPSAESVPPPPPSPRRPGASGGSSRPPVSRRGGALLLAGIVVIVVVVVLLTSGGGGSPTHTGTSASTGTSTASASKSSASKKTPSVTNQIELTPPESSSKAVGIVEILAEGTKRAFYLAAEHLPPSNGSSYVIWLYNSATSAEAISKTTVGSSGRTQGGALLPANAGEYHHILLTRETSEHATSPGPVVLSGTFSLNS
jgi:hypothetical protein